MTLDQLLIVLHELPTDALHHEVFVEVRGSRCSPVNEVATLTDEYENHMVLIYGARLTFDLTDMEGQPKKRGA